MFEQQKGPLVRQHQTGQIQNITTESIPLGSKKFYL